MGTILLKDILTEARIYSYSTDEILKKFLTFDGKTLVFLDTETTGLEPNNFYVQLTQVAMLVVDGSTYEVKEEFSTKVDIRPEVQKTLDYDPSVDYSKEPNSSPEIRAYHKDFQRRIRKYKRADKTTKELLGMTNYHGKDGTKMSEAEALIKVEQILKSYNQSGNVIIVAHNARFDMKVIQARRRANNLPPIQRYSVLDTLALSRFFFIPTLETIQNGNMEAKEFLEKLLAKTKYRSYTSTLGKLASVFKITTDNWHDASADVKILFQLLQKMIKYLEEHKNLNIDKNKGNQAKRFHNMRAK